MASWLIRSPLQYIPRRSPSDMAQQYGKSFVGVDGNAVSNSIAIFSPDMSAVTGWLEKYWELTGEVLTLADQSTRDSIDAAEISAQRDEIANDIDRVESYTRAFALVVLDEINILRAQHGSPARTLTQLKTAVRGKLNG